MVAVDTHSTTALSKGRRLVGGSQAQKPTQITSTQNQHISGQTLSSIMRYGQFIAIFPLCPWFRTGGEDTFLRTAHICHVTAVACSLHTSALHPCTLRTIPVSSEDLLCSTERKSHHRIMLTASTCTSISQILSTFCFPVELLHSTSEVVF